MRRVERTIVIFACYLGLTVLLLAFNPAQLTVWQNMASVIALGIIGLCTIAITWIRQISFKENTRVRVHN
jgi:uncharacterized membrane protein (DUF485 family)